MAGSIFLTLVPKLLSKTVLFSVFCFLFSVAVHAVDRQEPADQVRKRRFVAPFYRKKDHFTKTGLGQT
jgi:hypothetical protein